MKILKSPVIGIIGGTGLYQMEGVENIERVSIDTPFGTPSDPYIIGTLFGKRVVFLPRHGEGHRFSPSTINYRANVYGLKQLGVEYLLSVSAVGSLKEELKPGTVVLPDQFVDRTYLRKSTFYDDGIAVHVQFSQPICPVLQEIVYQSVKASGAAVCKNGTYLCIEGPQFSTRAESSLYRSWGLDVIGMTNLTEAKLAREAEISFVTIALITDYDCWHETEEEVSIDSVLKILKKNSLVAKDILKNTIQRITDTTERPFGKILGGSIITHPEHIPPEKKEKYALLLGKYF